ncbi:MAG: DUF420 domain-containing protein [Phycisphaerae bacterium]
MLDKEFFAALNAGLNLLATCTLVAGLVMIRRKRWKAHAVLMLTTLGISAVFLVSYLYSNFTFGSRSLEEIGFIPPWLRFIYLYIVLIPHVILAIVMLPMIGATIWRASTRQFEKHKRIARPTWAIWFYVSVTGVIVYLMLYQLFPRL